MNKNRRVIALGFFDGVHNGHGALLRRVVDKARELDAVAAAFTFDPVSYTHLDVYKRQHPYWSNLGACR